MEIETHKTETYAHAVRYFASKFDDQAAHMIILRD